MDGGRFYHVYSDYILASSVSKLFVVFLCFDDEDVDLFYVVLFSAIFI